MSNKNWKILIPILIILGLSMTYVGAHSYGCVLKEIPVKKLRSSASEDSERLRNLQQQQ
jgi:hypothetical protein